MQLLQLITCAIKGTYPNLFKDNNIRNVTVPPGVLLVFSSS
jgi:hypothetical protein